MSVLCHEEKFIPKGDLNRRAVSCRKVRKKLGLDFQPAKFHGACDERGNLTQTRLAISRRGKNLVLMFAIYFLTATRLDAQPLNKDSQIAESYL
jgi:hypothetical protein